jgi:hypothetical protein
MRGGSVSSKIGAGNNLKAGNNYFVKTPFNVFSRPEGGGDVKQTMLPKYSKLRSSGNKVIHIKGPFRNEVRMTDDFGSASFQSFPLQNLI